MTKVSGKHKDVSTTVPKSKPMTKMAWVPKIGQTKTVFIPIPKSKPKTKMAWVPKSN